MTTEGTGMRAFLIDDEDSLQRISIAKLQRLHNYEEEERMPEFAGKRVRYALVFLKTRDRKPDAIVCIHYSILSFDDNGKIDRQEVEAETRLTLKLMDDAMFPKEKTPGVINARLRFLEKQQSHKYKWTPTREIEEAINRRVFGDERQRS